MHMSQPFNSLFEMPERDLEILRSIVEKCLSILYLRCPQVVLGQARAGVRAAFNSLFEMQDLVYRLEPRVVARPFNSLFEMRM